MWRAVERFVLPNSCICCNSLVGPETPDALVCGVCSIRMRRVGTGTSCGRCMQLLPPVGPCRFCAEWTTALLDVRSAVWLGRESRRIVHQLKYGHARALARLVGDVIVNTFSRPPVTAVVPVPVGKWRLAERGYNQAALIAAELSERWRLTFLPEMLERREQSRSQTVLTPESRRANVASAFVARSRPHEHVGRNPLLVVDDVLTTGATIDACARALERVGWQTIRAVTFARAQTYQLRAVGY